MRLDPDSCRTCEPAGISGFGLRIGLSLVLAGQGMVFGLGYNNALRAGHAPDYGSPLYWILHGGLIFSALAVVALLGGPLFRETRDALRERRLSVEALFVLSAAGALGGSLVSTVTGTESVYYEVVSIVLCVYAIGKQIGAVQKGRVGQAVAAFRNAFDTAVVRDEAGLRKTLPVADVRPGQRVLIGPGDPVPVDGKITTGAGYLRETALTGEPAPVSRGPGDRVLAGTWSVDATLEVVRSGDGTRSVDRILDMLAAAPQIPSRLQVEADRLMQHFVPLVTATAVGTFAGWLLLSAVPWWEALFNAMAVLLVACPCALGLAMPTGIWAGLFHLSQRGIIGRHGSLIDALADCDAVVFDKTGTLSQFESEVTLIPFTDSDASEELAAEVASLARSSRHPVSSAIAALSPDEREVTGLVVHPGRGMEGRVAGVHLLMGERDWLEDRGIAVPPGFPDVPGKPVHLAREGAYTGCVLLQERLRPEAESSLLALREMGLACRILSGDPVPSRPRLGEIPVEGGLSPEAKAERVREWSESGKAVLFVGDGVNDVLAMEASRASLGIELGAALATEYADGVLSGGRVAVLPGAIRQARLLKERLQGNLRFALGYNLIGMALAAGGLLHPVVAALLMVGSSTVVSFRALRAASSLS
jgi:heavy metal translocating P-type ATPase